MNKEALIPDISISADVIEILPTITISSEENSKGANFGQIIVTFQRRFLHSSDNDDPYAGNAEFPSCSEILKK